MTNGRWWLSACILLGITASCFAQKIKVGYDKTVDFSKYKTYTWAKPQTPVSRPLLYENVVGEIDDELKSKGLTTTEQNGDLTVVAGGGIGLGVNMPLVPAFDAMNWNGEDNPAVLMDPLVAEGSLIVEFIDRTNNKMIWRGTATENLDPEMAKALPAINKAIVKLLKGYPPRHSSK